ncbi:MAG: flagellar hook-associated protein FlgL [Parvibaculales bacterium]
MQVSTKFFNDRQVEQFAKINKDVQTVQEKIASGQNILKASDDPVAAVQLSAAKEQQNLLGRYETNIDAAKRRLTLADGALQEGINVLTRITELSVQAANGSYGPADRRALLAEAEELRQVMFEIANTRDAQGQSLFAGFRSNDSAFTMSADGQISYAGDRGLSALQISENMTVATSLDGGTVFERVQTPQGQKGLFAMLDAAMAAIDPANALSVEGSARATAALTFNVSKDPQNWAFQLQGSRGSERISVSIADGKYDDLVDAINLQTASTGIIANYDSASGRVMLSDEENGMILMKDIEIENVGLINDTSPPTVDFATIDGSGAEIGIARRLGDNDLLIGGLSEDLDVAIDHLSTQKAFLGAQINKADRQMEVIAKRQMAVSEEVADIGEADLAALITELQSMLVSRDAAQQAFSKIGQQSLFDYLR